MSDTTNTPEESRGRGSVATGVSSGQVSNKPAADDPTIVAPAPELDGATSVDPAPAAEPAADDESTKVERPVAAAPRIAMAKAPTPVPPVPPTPEPPTIQHQVPEYGGSNGNGSNGSGAPRPAPGPVPGPGPGSDTPPPWNRIPGNEPARPPSGEVASHPVSDLLNDGPTAYFEPPTPPNGTPAAPDEERTGSVSSSWRSARTRPPRQAALQLKRLDPWSVLKLALVLAVVLFLIFLVAVGVLYGVLDGMGVWDRLNGTYADLVANTSPGASPLISVWSVFSLAAVVGAINSLLFAVAVTISAFVYNVSADLVGGVEVTLSERD